MIVFTVYYYQYTVIIHTASEWILSRFMALYKCYCIFIILYLRIFFCSTCGPNGLHETRHIYHWFTTFYYFMEHICLIVYIEAFGLPAMKCRSTEEQQFKKMLLNILFW